MPKLNQFRPQRLNANQHTPMGLKALETSIQADGWIGAMTAAADGEIFDGSARIETAGGTGFENAITVESDGTTPIIIVRTDIPTADDPRAKRLGLMANRVAELNLSWDADLIAALVAEAPSEDRTLAALLERMVEETGGSAVVAGQGGDEFDATPDDGPTRTAVGDLWVIGGVHRLLVGDCTNAANVARLMDGEWAALCFTSPPYNSKSELHGNDRFRGSFYLDKSVDAMTPAEYRAFSQNVFTSIGLSVSNDGNVCYNISYNKNNRDGYIFVIADAIDAGFNLYETIAWLKTGMPNPASTDVLTRDYEFVFLLNRADTYQTTKHNREVRSNVWEINNNGAQQDNHKACFPVGLPTRAIEDMTQDNDIIIDLFLGSGTTLIAAHRTGRRCYGLELEPRYADVILKRAEAEGLTCERVHE